MTVQQAAGRSQVPKRERQCAKIGQPAGLTNLSHYDPADLLATVAGWAERKLMELTGRRVAAHVLRYLERAEDREPRVEQQDAYRMAWQVVLWTMWPRRVSKYAHQMGLYEYAYARRFGRSWWRAYPRLEKRSGAQSTRTAPQRAVGKAAGR